LIDMSFAEGFASGEIAMGWVAATEYAD